MDKRKNYGLFMALLENEFSNQILRGAAQAALETDSNLFVFPIGIWDTTFNDPIKNQYRYQVNALSMFLDSYSLDGIVIEYGTITSAITEEKKIEFLSKTGNIPTILLAEDAPGFPSICFDNEAGLRDVIFHLINDHGYRKIGFISGPANNHDAQVRLKVYLEVMEESGLGLGMDWVEYGNFSIRVEKPLRKLIENHPDIEAIVFANDGMAYNSVDYLIDMGYIPGQNIFITGFDNILSSIVMDPALTTVSADTSELSYRAIKALYNNEDLSKLQNVSTRMIVRQSCGCSSPLVYSSDGRLLGTQSELDFKKVALSKIKEGDRSKYFIVDIGNIMRNIVYSQGDKLLWIKSVLETTQRLKFAEGYILLYDKAYSRTKGDYWIPPKEISLVGYYRDEEMYTYDKGEYILDSKNIFADELFMRDNRTDYVILPLFFQDKQYGLFITSSQIEQYEFAYQITAQIGASLEMISIIDSNIQIQNELEYANKSKSQFLANMSHEIRTPINAIIGMNEMILRENAGSTIDGYANDIKDASNALLSTVNEILDFSKIESGKMELITQDYSLSSLLTQTINMVNFRIQGKNITLSLNCDSNLPSVLHGDDVRIRQILINLLTNGIKYTPEGSVTLNVTGHMDSSSANAQITFSVTDTGIGIKKEDLDKLFIKFERIEEERNRNIEGTGLGMNISAGLLTLMNSSLNVESEYNKGSTFSFTLEQPVVDSSPVGKVSAKSGIRKEKKQYHQKFSAPEARILLVDDNRVNRLVITRLLNKTGVIIEEASNGEECLDMLRRNQYDLILLDHMMPIMDGMETMAHIIESPDYIKGQPPVIALTANAILGVKKEYIDAGFDGYLSKPVIPDELEDLLINFLPKEKIILPE